MNWTKYGLFSSEKNRMENKIGFPEKKSYHENLIFLMKSLTMYIMYFKEILEMAV